MNIVLFCHPAFMNSHSMPRFAKMLEQSYSARGHEVAIWSPEAICHRWFPIGTIGKWLGYVDQYLLFPFWVRHALRQTGDETLFVFCDQALGPWVPLVAHRHHVIHCHDFLALQSALGLHPQNPVKLTGRIYQRYIRRGFQRGRNFISVSHHTRTELTQYLLHAPMLSEAVHNGLNFKFAQMARDEAAQHLSNLPTIVPDTGMLVHVGSNAWYKNRKGVMRIYAAYCRQCEDPLPLWMVGDAPSPALRELATQVGARGKVYFLSGLSNVQVQAVYSLAKALIFPSLAEGFGWPIAEAMACGCAVLTTGAAPMTEVGGDAVSYIPVMPDSKRVAEWADDSATVLRKMLNASESDQARRRQAGFEQVRQFDAERAISSYEQIYRRVLAQRQHSG